ncbi:MAG: Ribonuclease BN [Candidatus Roizmanbacteria bacterium GW2011_GWA2_37_7]|uniref:Ribonuclease BN n=1 Tax=Candidatus Roizmanbacteria bacterium GW2011_GWA2_37_7 TaxID=1618481 RepID=A0A0G0H3S6_9BACT|nr:MAG: Ribonuclease BN [Candidatus Roizmanbacteria bacterium GW2011_GWA2_37_7]
MNRIAYLLKTTFKEFVRDNAAQMAAALAYYALFAIPPILLISINILSIFLEDTQARHALISQAQNITEGSTTEILKLIIDHLHQYADQGNIAKWIGIITLIIAASGAFSHLQASLNTIWDIAPHPSRSVSRTIERRLSAMLFIFMIGMLILASFISNAFLSKVGIYISAYVGISPFLLQTINMLASFVGITCFITLIYKLIPEGNMAWKDIFVGALVTAFLFIFGKYIVSLVIANSTFSTIYGAAGSLLILLIWVYYLSLIFFFGAEFTQIYSNLHGKGIKHDEGTLHVIEKILLENKNVK